MRLDVSRGYIVLIHVVLRKSRLRSEEEVVVPSRV